MEVMPYLPNQVSHACHVCHRVQRTGIFQWNDAGHVWFLSVPTIVCQTGAVRGAGDPACEALAAAV